MIRQFLTGLDLSALCQRSIDALIDIINFGNPHKRQENATKLAFLLCYYC